jgi:hypothetical protein
MSGIVAVAPSASRALREDVAAACRALSLRAVSLEPGETHGRPRLVVSTLRTGERAIPRDALDASEGAGEGARVLLVAEERLVRPTVTLQGGRVTLLGGPASPERLRGVLRMLAEPPATTARREALTTSAWVASSLPSPALAVRDDRIAAVVAFEEIDERAIDRACGALAAPGGEARIGELSRELAGRAGLLLYCAAARQLVVSWPRRDRAAWVCSPVRLPAAADLAAAAAWAPDHVVKLATVSGDVAVALAARDLDAAATQRVATDGAAALVEGLGPRAPGLVMEVR